MTHEFVLYLTVILEIMKLLKYKENYISFIKNVLRGKLLKIDQILTKISLKKRRIKTNQSFVSKNL